MFVKKLIELTISVANPIGFCADFDNNLRIALEQYYVGICFAGIFITKIDEIVKHSPCHIVTNNTSGEGYIDVQIMASGIMILADEILPDITVFNREGIILGKMVGHNVLATITELGLENELTYPSGKQIPIRVIKSSTSPMTDKILVVGTHLTCDFKFTKFYLDEILTASEPITKAYERVLSEIEKRNQYKIEDIAFFESLLFRYPAKTTPKFVEANGAKWLDDEVPNKVNLLDIVAKIVAGGSAEFVGEWTRPLTLHRSSPFACQGPANAEQPVVEAVVAVVSMLTSMYNTLGIVNYFCGRLSEDPTYKEQNKHVWDNMKIAQHSNHS